MMNLIRINPVILPEDSLDRRKGVNTVRCTSALYTIWCTKWDEMEPNLGAEFSLSQNGISAICDLDKKVAIL